MKLYGKEVIGKYNPEIVEFAIEDCFHLKQIRESKERGLDDVELMFDFNKCYRLLFAMHDRVLHGFYYWEGDKGEELDKLKEVVEKENPNADFHDRIEGFTLAQGYEQKDVWKTYMKYVPEIKSRFKQLRDNQWFHSQDEAYQAIVRDCIKLCNAIEERCKKYK